MVAVRGDGYGGKGNKSDSFSVGPKIESSGNDLGSILRYSGEAIACVCGAKPLCVLLALQRHVQHEDGHTKNRGAGTTAEATEQRSTEEFEGQNAALR